MYNGLQNDKQRACIFSAYHFVPCTGLRVNHPCGVQCIDNNGAVHNVCHGYNCRRCIFGPFWRFYANRVVFSSRLHQDYARIYYVFKTLTSVSYSTVELCRSFQKWRGDE